MVVHPYVPLDERCERVDQRLDFEPNTLKKNKISIVVKDLYICSEFSLELKLLIKSFPICLIQSMLQP